MPKNIVIVGAGYGGLLTALTAREHLTEAEATITLINRDATHQIITELHRLAVGSITEKAVALPLAKLLREKHVNLVIDSVQSIHPDDCKVTLGGGKQYHYDTLVIGLGSETAFFGIPGLEQHSFTLKSVSDANRIRLHMERCLHQYKQSGEKAYATFVIGGGGLTGIELVGEFADRLPDLCKQIGVDYKDIALYTVEAGPSVLAGFPQPLIERAKQSLEKRGVQFICGVPITEMTKQKVILKDGTSISTNTLVWTGGVQGHPIVAHCGIDVDRGRAKVTPYLQSTSHPNVFVAGDSAVVFPMEKEGERPYPPTAQLAWQMGETIGRNISASYKTGPMERFTPIFSGTLGSLGRKDAIGIIGSNQICLKGTPATLMKEASNIRYLSHIHALFSLAY